MANHETVQSILSMITPQLASFNSLFRLNEHFEVGWLQGEQLKLIYVWHK